MPFRFEPVRDIPGLVVVEPRVFEDQRGFFMESYSLRDFSEAGIGDVFVQDNHSRSVKNTLRGLHFQREPAAQSKLVWCIRGEIYDVAVDLRRGSPAFGRWFAATLSEANRKMLYIPRGFAHGFLVLSDEAEVLYKADNFYSPEHDGGIAWNDPQVGVRWPAEDPVLSDKDRALPTLEDAGVDFPYGERA